jgi:hypothetical protein
VISSWNVTQKARAYFALYLLLTEVSLGCFLAQDFFLFYLFFEFMLLPMYFLIGLWGGPRREYAALKFFIYTFLGSLADPDCDDRPLFVGDRSSGNGPGCGYSWNGRRSSSRSYFSNSTMADRRKNCS